MFRIGEYALDMGQSRRGRLANMRVVQIKLRVEEFVLGMVQKGR